MAPPKLQKMFGGVVPGGVITITAGTPISVISNLALASIQTSPGGTLSRPFSVLCRQITFSVDASPSGEVYVNYGNFAGKGNATALIIQSGTTQSMPLNCLLVEGEIDAAQWYLDGSASCVVAVNFADASS